MSYVKKTALLIISLALVFGVNPAAAQGIYLDHVDGLENGYIPEAGTLTFHMRVTGDATNHLMLNNGFVFSSDGLVWGDLTGELNPAYDWDLWFDFVKVINYWKTGSGADTVGVGLLSLFGSGLPAGFDDIAYSFTIGPISGIMGNDLTLDSTWYPPSNPWMWDIVGANVAWGGPYVFSNCCPPPDYTWCEPQPTVLKDIERILYIYIDYVNVDDVDLESIRIQGNIPSYEPAYVEGGTIVASVFIMRFLGASGFRPITSDFETTYTVDYNYIDGTPAPQLVGDYSLIVYPGDVTFDGECNLDDVVVMTDYFWREGDVCTFGEYEVAEFMDIDGDGDINPLDLRALIGLAGY